MSQLALDRVLVDWRGLVTKEECADNYIVKYWRRHASVDYHLTDIIPAGRYHVEVQVDPKVEYRFQAVAREEKGIVGGVDWNKSKPRAFTTSTNNRYIG